MNRYMKAVLGGFLAILYGWLISTFTLAIMGYRNSRFWIPRIPTNLLEWVLLLLIYFTGFCWAFRAKNSK